MASTYIGIDPGLTGALSVLDPKGKVLLLEDLPVMASGGGVVKSQLNPAGIAELLKPFAKDARAALERTTAMPEQGVASMFSMGDSYGVLRAVLAVLRIPTEVETPAKWKRAMALTADKELSRARAIQLFPEVSLRRKKDHNRAEALLLAEWLRRNHEKAR